MRDIKFRCWEKDIKGMLEWDELNINECIKDKGCIVMQYTGLKDKNGKEIYEGDIVDKYNNAVVCFSNGRFQPRYDGGMAEDVEDDFWRFADECIVIGNIHENKDLLK